jgi:hypothetical protein
MKQGQRGTTASDEAARFHDLDYLKIGTDLKNKKITRDQAAKEVRIADDKLQSRIRQGLKTDHSLLNKIHAAAGDTGMAIKKIGEDIGAISGTAFLGAGKERDPAYRLRKLAAKIKAKKGGALPLYKIKKPQYLTAKPSAGGSATRYSGGLIVKVPKVPPPRNIIDIGPAPLVLSKVSGGAAEFSIDRNLLQKYLESLPVPILEKLNAVAASGGLMRYVKRARRRTRRY